MDLEQKQVVKLSLIVIVTAWLALFLVRLTGPPDLVDNNQQKPAAYMLDAARNGHWIVQLDDRGGVTSKPPVCTWIAALIVLLSGRSSTFALMFPGALGMLGCTLLIWRYGSRYFGHAAGLVAAVAYLLSPAGAKMVYFARTDSLFAFTVALTALLGFSAWLTGRGWTWFWLAGAAATLTKGPLGVILAAGGLMAHFWEKRRDPDLRFRGKHWVGVTLFVVITLGWLALAYWQLGHRVTDKLIGRELLGHADWAGMHKFPGEAFHKPFLYFLSRLLPWSLFSCIGLWRVWRRPALELQARRFERFLFCWFSAGVLIFSFSPHQRADLLQPLFPPVALLAGREVVRLLRLEADRRFFRRLALFCLAVLVLAGAYYHLAYIRKQEVVQSRWLKDLAGQVEARFGADAPIVFADAPYVLQFYLGRIQLQVGLKKGAAALTGDAAVLVAVHDEKRFESLLPQGVTPYVIMRRPREGEPFLTIYSNTPNGPQKARQGEPRKE